MGAISTIIAYDRREIELPELSQDAWNASTEFASPTSEKPFTKLQIARLLGKTKQNGKEGNYGFEKAWKTLDLIEKGIRPGKRPSSLRPNGRLHAEPYQRPSFDPMR